MKSAIDKLHEISQKKTKTILGLMSGTSLDGLDIACCKIEGSGKDTKVSLLKYCTLPYPASFQDNIRRMVSASHTSLMDMTLLNVQIAQVHANLINTALKNWGMRKENIDVIASHGQTVFHAPVTLHQQKEMPDATLQLGDGDHIATTTGIITISDFRQKHVAHGGEGAPLVSYGDFLIFKNAKLPRILLNIGGIANITYLPANCEFKEVIATDTGPGNCLMDAWIRKNYTEIQFDYNGKLAATGKILPELLHEWLQHHFFTTAFPKTTGTESFHLDFIESGITKCKLNNILPEDVLATLNLLTALTISDVIKKTMTQEEEFELFISGGGLYNKTLINQIIKQLPNRKISDSAHWPIHPDAKEAVLFALLANETLSGDEKTFDDNNQQPNISMGKICLPI
jgi:anhydro-N-acetylmuramic acid kinase